MHPNESILGTTVQTYGFKLVKCRVGPDSVCCSSMIIPLEQEYEHSFPKCCQEHPCMPNMAISWGGIPGALTSFRMTSLESASRSISLETPAGQMGHAKA